MILAKMEYHPNVLKLPLDFTDDTCYLLTSALDEKLYGRKRKKKQMVSVLKSHVANALRKCQADHSYVACGNPADQSNDAVQKVESADAMLETQVDMEAFFKINVPSADKCANLDQSVENYSDLSNIMLSSSCAGRSHSESSSSTCTAMSSISDLDIDELSATSNVSLTPSDTEADADLLQSPINIVPTIGAFPDLGSFLTAGSLLSDITLQDFGDDLYGGAASADEDGNSLLAYCPRAMKREPARSSGPSMMEQLDNFLHGDNIDTNDSHSSDVKPELELSLDDYLSLSHGNSETLEQESTDIFSCDEMESVDRETQPKAVKRKAKPESSADQRQHIRQRLELSDDEPIMDDDECIYSSGSGDDDKSRVFSYHATSKKGSVSRPVARRGPGRPRKSVKPGGVRRGPGRPRKKSISDTVAWYQSQRKRTVSFSHRSRNSSTSPVRYELNDEVAVVPSKSKLSLRTVSSKPARLRRSGSDGGKNTAQKGKLDEAKMNRTLCGSPLTNVTPCESDDDDIVDVVTVNDGSLSEDLCELYDVSSLGELVRHVSLLHCYHSMRPVASHRATPSLAPLRRSSNSQTSKFSINLPISPKKAATSWSSAAIAAAKLHGVHHAKKLTAEQRAKRENLNDLERQRRCDLSRAMTALRAAVPAVRDNSRAAKIVVLESAVDHIHGLERQSRLDQNVLKAERERYASLQAQLGRNLPSDECDDC